MININNKKDCCGCSACVQRCGKHCITLKEDAEGFLYPQVDTEICTNCGLCEKVCPCLNEVKESHPSKQETYAAINTNEDERMNSSSGGIFVQLAQKTIADGGVVFGAAFDANWEVHHVAAETKEEVKLLMGSKYLQSRIENTYKEAEQTLKSGRKVLFTGTSCQIKGLLAFLRKPYDNLLAVDVICHGAPSPGVWRRYVNALNQKAAQWAAAGKNTVLSLSLNEEPALAGISFRDKNQSGWKKYCFVVRTSPFKGDQNSVLSSVNATEDSFMRGFLANIYLRPSCYDCRAKGGRSGADITLADFWGINTILPEWDDDKGTSLVVTHTEKGRNAFAALEVKKTTVESEFAFRHNVSYFHSVDIPKCRPAFFSRFQNGETVSAIIESLLYVPKWSKALRKVKQKAKGAVKKTLRLVGLKK